MRLRYLLLLLLLLLPTAIPAEESLEALQSRLTQLYEAGQYQEALEVAQQALEASRRLHGAEHAKTLECLGDIATLHVALQEPQKAVEILLDIVAIEERTLGASHFEVANTLTALATVHIQTQNFQQARPLLERALRIRREQLGEEHLQTAISLNNLGLCCYHQKEYELAETLFLKALPLEEAAYGKDSIELDTLLENLMASQRALAHWPQAIATAERLLSVRRRHRGEQHPSVAALLGQLAQLYQGAGDVKKAMLYTEKALDLRLSEIEKAPSPEHLSVVKEVEAVATLYQLSGQKDKALALLQRALELRRKIQPADHPEWAAALENLGLMYSRAEQHQKAIPLLDEALELARRRDNQEKVATLLNNLGYQHRAQGDFDEAEKLYRQALELRIRNQGAEHAQTASVHNNLGALYISMGDLLGAKPHLEKALAIKEKVFGPKHAEVANALNNLGYLNSELGDYKAAGQAYEKALDIKKETLGPEHREVATVMGNLASVYQSLGQLDKAGPLLEQALAIEEKALGPEATDTAYSLNNLADYHASRGQPEKAYRYFQRAAVIFEKQLGAEHPITATALDNLAIQSLALGRREEALELARRVAQARLAVSRNVFSFAAERQRSDFVRSLAPFNLFASLGSGGDLMQQVLRYKGVVLDSVVEDLRLARASQNPEVAALLARLRSARKRESELDAATPADLKMGAEIKRLENDLTRAVRGLGRARRAFSVKISEVQAALPPQSALIEFVRFYDYAAPRPEGGPQPDYQERYGALVLTADSEPHWVVLPSEATRLERYIGRYRRMVRGSGMSAEGLLSSLYQEIWKPLQDSLPSDTRTVVISPDAQLNFISFATLLAEDGRFLCQQHQLVYVSSGRDLLASQARGDNREAVLLADPDYKAGGAKQGSSTLGQALGGRWTDLNFTSLPYTADECSAVGELLEEQRPVRLLTGAQAREAELRALEAPAILHLATHGFFLGGFFPMHSSGLALAGAQHTVESQRRGVGVTAESDGFLTSAEAGLLQLEGTWLATLSACDTGAGNIERGEGVLGLRRGFALAGAQNLLMTLWPVADLETSQLMQDFYRALGEQSPPLALHQVQAKWLVQLRKQRSLEEAVRLAGPFVLTFQGRL